MSKVKKITEREFIKLIVDKELEVAGVPYGFDDIIEDLMLPKEQQKIGEKWFDKYEFGTPEKYIEWKNFVYDHFYDWKPKHTPRKFLNQWFSEFRLNWGLKYGFDHNKLEEIEKNGK